MGGRGNDPCNSCQTPSPDARISSGSLLTDLTKRRAGKGVLYYRIAFLSDLAAICDNKSDNLRDTLFGHFHVFPDEFTVKIIDIF